MTLKFNPEPYGSNNFHVERGHTANHPNSPLKDTLNVILSYPPWEEGADERVRYIEVDQESVRASDGIRLHYDFHRDGWVVCQPTWKLVQVDDTKLDSVHIWTEVGFFQSWALDQEDIDTKIANAGKDMK